MTLESRVLAFINRNGSKNIPLGDIVRYFQQHKTPRDQTTYALKRLVDNAKLTVNFNAKNRLVYSVPAEIAAPLADYDFERKVWKLVSERIGPKPTQSTVTTFAVPESEELRAQLRLEAEETNLRQSVRTYEGIDQNPALLQQARERLSVVLAALKGKEPLLPKLIAEANKLEEERYHAALAKWLLDEKEAREQITAELLQKSSENH